MATIASASLVPGELSQPILDKEIEHLLFVPKDYDKKNKYPTILFLHGTGGVKRGFDNIRGQSLTRMLLNKSVPGGDEFPFIVITPRADKRDWQNHFSNLDLLLSRLTKELSIDTNRFYLVGQSMGGNGVWEYGVKNKDMFAAMVPVCGYVDRKNAKTGERVGIISKMLSDKPIYVFHAATDAIVSVDHSDGMVESLKNAGNQNVQYTRYDDAPGLPNYGPRGAGHASYELAFKDEKLYQWLLKHSLDTSEM
jgi:predicted peptidase